MVLDYGIRVQVTNIPDFWTRLRTSSSRLLALDYDGTLAPFHLEPMKAFPLPGIAGTLVDIAEREGTTLAIVSGRPLNEVLTLLGDLEITYIGSHGYEMRRPNGELAVRSPSLNQLRGLETARELVERRGMGHKLEIKVCSVALHTRGMDLHAASTIEQAVYSDWSRLSVLYDLECMEFNGGVELRSKGLDKGCALQELLSGQPPNTLSVYIGDDRTDEDAFRVVERVGIGIKVGRQDIPTAASGFLPSCEAVKDFLETWLALTATLKGRERHGA